MGEQGFWIWFWRPIGEFLGAIAAFFIIFAFVVAALFVAAARDKVKDWANKLRAKKEQPPVVTAREANAALAPMPPPAQKSSNH
jgi:hypothetical protein